MTHKPYKTERTWEEQSVLSCIIIQVVRMISAEGQEHIEERQIAGDVGFH